MTTIEALQIVIDSYKYFIKEQLPRRNYIYSVIQQEYCPLCIIYGARCDECPVHDCLESENFVWGHHDYTPEKGEMARNRIKELEQIMSDLKSKQNEIS